VPPHPRLGIDLGTTNSLVALFDGDAPRLIRNAHGSVLTPSVVGLLPSGEVVVGEPARHLALTAPERVVATFKRWMGSERKVELADQTFSAPELSSLVLASLKRDAEVHLGCAVERAVVTVPAYFNQLQRAATVRAAQLAGLQVERIVNEPTAAALTYGFHRREQNRRLVVFDLGGGTFDVTVMEIFDGALEIKSTAGESRLGGEDFNELLVREALARIERNLELAEMREPLLVARLRSEAEAAKRALTACGVALLRLPDSRGRVDDAAQVLKIEAARFAELAQPLLERIRRPALRALADARLGPTQIDEVILVGGATRMPLVQQLAAELFERVPRHEVHPDEAVALGAAIQAALVADDRAVEDLVMTDVCPQTLGVEVTKEFGTQRIGGYFLPVLHRNTTIPVSREESVYTLDDGQRELSVRVYQGESRNVKNNVLLGELKVSDLPPAPRGLHVVLRYTYDLNGLLEVEAIVPSTGRRCQLLIVPTATTMSEDELRAATEKLARLKLYPREKLENQRLLAFATAALRELDPERRQALERVLDFYEQNYLGNDAEAFAAARTLLIAALREVGAPYDEGAP
jgi:molecular chaperone HscC